MLDALIEEIWFRITVGIAFLMVCVGVVLFFTAMALYPDTDHMPALGLVSLLLIGAAVAIFLLIAIFMVILWIVIGSD